MLRALLKQAPDVDEAYIGLADAANKSGNAAQEVEALERLAQRKPDYPMIHLLLARALVKAQPVNGKRVERELSLAERQSPTDADIPYLRGKTLIALSRYQDAVQPLERSIELRPMEAGPYYQLARVYQKLGKPELARDLFERIKFLEITEAKK